MRIVIVQTAFLGDVILTLPLCAAAKKLFPKASVVLVATPAAADFARGLSVVDDVIPFDKRNAHRTMRAQHQLAVSMASVEPTIVLVPHKSLRTALFVRSLRADRTITFRDAATRWFATDIVEYPQHAHDSRRNLELLRPLLPADNAMPNVDELLPIDLSDPGSTIDVWSDDRSTPRVVLAPATVWPTKQWPLERMRELARMCVHDGMQVCVIGDATVAGMFADIEGVSDLAGRTTLRQAATIIASASCVVANDSAPVHLASLQRVGVAALFGPTVPEFGFGPLGERARIVQRADLECRPCSAHGGARCPLGTHACMTGISVDTVFETLHTILAHDVNRHAKSNETIV